MRRYLVILALLILPAIAAAQNYESPTTTAQGPYTLQSAATTGNGATWTTRHSTAVTVLYLRWSAGCSAGAVTFETAEDDQAGSAGTWAPLATVNWSAASKVDEIKIFGAIGTIRARISTNVVGGTVTVTAKGLK
ncbi:MAG: hypothetical protein PHU75_03905 [Candidatus Nanopelagicales bacterium]|nr:hypothetical protein [Candidatus Nanopelagicales bacterium]